MPPALSVADTQFTEFDRRDYTDASIARPEREMIALRGKSATCIACHGPDGNSPVPIYPRLAGQYEDYLRKALTDYQNSARQNPIMKGMAAPLSAQDIADLSAWFASQPGGLVTVQQD